MYMRAWENQSAFRDPDGSRSNFRLERTGYAGRSPERSAYNAAPEAVRSEAQ